MAEDYFQLGYVTNDFDRAIAQIREAHSMGPFKELRNLRLPMGSDRFGTSHYALAFKAGLQFEIIQPLNGDVTLYRDMLPDDEYSLRLHHLGRFFASGDEFQEERRKAAERWPIPAGAEVFGGHYCYIDRLAELGYYLEIFSFPGDEHLEGVPRY